MKLDITTALQFNQILRQLSLVLTSVLLAKTYLPTASIGVYETLVFIGTSVSYFWLNALIQTTLSFLPSLKGGRKAAAPFSIYLLVCGLSFAVFSLLFFFKTPLLYFFVGKPELPFYDLFACFLLLNLPPYLLESFLTIEKYPLSIFLFSSLTNLGLIAAIILPLAFGLPFQNSFYGMIAIATLRFIWLTLYVFRNSSLVLDKEIGKAFTLLCLPMIGYSFLNGFTTTYTSWLVNWFYAGNAEQFAIFRFGAREFPLALALATGLSNAFVPILAANTEGGINLKNSIELNHLKQKTKKIWHMLFPCSIGLILSSKWFFPIVFNPQFAASAAVFNVFLLLLTSRALFPQTILLALKETKVMLRISMIETLAIMILSYLLIFAFNTVREESCGEGVAWAIVLGFLIEKISIIFFLKRRYGIDFQSYTDVRLYFFYSGLLLLAYFFS